MTIGFSIILILLFGLCYKLECLGNFGLAVSITICPSLIMLFTLSKVIHYISNNKLVSFLGNISYGIYLWNLALVMLFYFIQDMFGFEVDYGSKLFFFATIIITIFISSITYLFF